MPINMFTKTKVIATIGPSTNSYEKLKNLHKAGMNVVRINMSHANHAYAQAIINHVKKLNNQWKLSWMHRSSGDSDLSLWDLYL